MFCGIFAPFLEITLNGFQSGFLNLFQKISTQKFIKKINGITNQNNMTPIRIKSQIFYICIKSIVLLESMSPVLTNNGKAPWPHWKNVVPKVTLCQICPCSRNILRELSKISLVWELFYTSFQYIPHMFNGIVVWAFRMPLDSTNILMANMFLVALSVWQVALSWAKSMPQFPHMCGTRIGGITLNVQIALDID